MPKETKYLLVVGGPTASGKTGLAIQLAQHFNAPILSTDSRQFYEEMAIGTARPNKEELVAAQHFFIADRSIHTPLSAGQFATEALVLLEELFQKHQYVIAVGGSGLFIKALTEGLDAFPQIPPAIKLRSQTLFETEGLNGLREAVQKEDPAYFETVDQHNPMRLMRALEVCWAGDRTYTEYRLANTKKRPFTSVHLQCSWPRETLYERINQRVLNMVKEGLENEAKQLLPFQELKSLQTVGYQEWFDFFEGKSTREEAIALIQQNSRRYAKRQLTWFRRDGYWKYVFEGDIRSALAYIQLVTAEDLQIALIESPDKKTTENTHTRVKSIGLKNGSSGAFVAEATVTISKKESAITEWNPQNSSFLAQSILLHQAVHLTEAAEVLGKTGIIDSVLLKSQGWKVVTDDSAESNSSSEKWHWKRSKSSF